MLFSACTQATTSVGMYGVYALTNAWFVSRGAGVTAFTAVNLAAPILLGVSAIAATVGAGGASLVSRSLGAGDTRQAARAAGNAITIFYTLVTTGTVLGLLLLDPLLTVLGAVGATRGYAHDYVLILLCGALTLTGFSSLVRAEGRLRFVTWMWVLSGLTQLLLDPLLIFGFDLGVRGAAAGTIAGNAVSMLMGWWFFFIRADRTYRITTADLRPDVRIVRQLAGIGAPSMLTTVGSTVLLILANHLIGAGAAVPQLAAFALCSRISTFTQMPQRGIALGLQPVAGYNTGRQRPDRVRRALTLSLRSSVLYGCTAAVSLALAAPAIAAAFTTDVTVRAATATTLLIFSGVYPFAGIAPIISGYCQALGRPRTSYLISAGTLVAVKIPLLLTFSLAGTTMMMLSFPGAEAVTAGVSLYLLRRGTGERRGVSASGRDSAGRAQQSVPAAVRRADGVVDAGDTGPPAGRCSHVGDQ